MNHEQKRFWSHCDGIDVWQRTVKAKRRKQYDRPCGCRARFTAENEVPRGPPKDVTYSE